MASKSKTFKFKFTGDAKDLSRATGSVEKDLGGLGGKIGGMAKKIAGGMAVAFAVDKIVGFGKELYNLGAEADIWQKKADIVFGDSVGMVRDWAAENAAAMGMTKSEVTGAAAAMGDLLVPMGFTREAAANMSTGVLDLSGALSAWSGGTKSVTEVNDVLSKALLGERDGLKSLGISISAVEVDQRALAVAQAEGRDEVTAMDKALATQQLIMEKSTDAQDAWAGSMHDGTKNINRTKAAVAELKERIGTALLPIVDKVIAYIVDSFIPALQELAEWLGPKITVVMQALSDWWATNAPKIADFLIMVKDKAIEFAQGFMEGYDEHIKPAVDNMMTAVSDLWATIEPIFGHVAGGLDSMGLDWGRVGGAVALVVGAMIENMSQTIAKVALVVSTTVSAVNTFIRKWKDGEGAVGKFRTTVETMASAVNTGIDGVKRGFGLASIGIRAALTTAGTALNTFKDIAGRVRDSLQWVIDKFNAMKGLLSSGISIPTPNWPKPPSWMSGLVPGFHAGTHSVPGSPGQNVPAILQAGERVLSVAQTRSHGGSGSGGMSLVVNAYGATGREMIAEIERAVRDGARSGWLSTAGIAA